MTSLYKTITIFAVAILVLLIQVLPAAATLTYGLANFAGFSGSGTDSASDGYFTVTGVDNFAPPSSTINADSDYGLYLDIHNGSSSVTQSTSGTITIAPAIGGTVFTISSVTVVVYAGQGYSYTFAVKDDASNVLGSYTVTDSANDGTVSLGGFSYNTKTISFAPTAVSAAHIVITENSINHTGVGNSTSVMGFVVDGYPAVSTPFAPSITGITPGDGQLSVAFTAGATGGSAITNYKYSTNGGTSFTAVSPASTTSPIVITGLTNGTTYQVQIKAVNTIGDGAASASSSGTPATTPSAPTITGITPGNGQLSVAFTAGATGGSAITNYKYSTNGGTSFTAVSPASTTSPIVITGLTNGTTYQVQIKAVNAIGDGAATASSSGTPGTAPTVTTQAASGIAATAVTGKGTITATNGANATARGVVYYAYTNTDKVIGDAGVTNISEAGDFGIGAFTESLPSLSVNTQYNARAYATSPNGTGYGARVAFWTLANVPSAPTVNNPASTTLDVAVNANDNPTGTEFAIQETSTGKYVQSDGSLGASAVWQIATTWGTKTVTGLTTGTTYTFQVKARNGGSTETAYGATASGTPVIVTVTGISPSSGPVAGGISVTISGTNFTGVTGVTIGGLAATGISVVNATTITATTPAGSAGIRDVVVTTPAGSGTGAGIFTYIATPTATAATAITISSFTANWGSAGGATGYYLDVATDAGFTNFVSVYNNLGVGNVTSKTITGLTSATLYYYRVRAYNSGGTSADSTTISLTTGQSRIVTISGDSGAGSLRQSIADATPGDTITFSVTGTITLASPLVISKDLTISGPGAGKLTISGNGTVQPFQVSAGITFNLQNLTVANGKATATDGGALADNSSATTIITGCAFTGNSATGTGGAIAASGTMTISDTLFSGNTATTYGGAISVSGALALTNVTITGNTATSGGGIYTTAGTTALINTTIASNNATIQGGGIDVAGGTLSLKNTIVAGNAAGIGNDISGSITSLGYNLIKNTSGAIFTATTGDLAAGSDPKLGTVADNGGPTQTMALLFGSPAIDAGTCTGAPSADQRGMPRPQNSSCDMGAYERGVPAALTATAGTSQSTALGSTFATALAAKVTDSLGGPLDGITVTYAGSGGTADIVAGGTADTGTTGVASFTATANGVAGGPYTVTATYGTFSAIYSLTNSKLSQSIAFTNPGAKNYGTTPVLSATATSNLTVTFSSSTTSVCTITTGGTLTFLTTGTCTINAEQAGNGTYAGASTVTQSFIVNAVVPGAPTIGTATAGNAQATVTFSPPASTGGVTISSYTVTSSGGQTATGTSSPITVTGLTNGTAYTFTVTAYSSAGTGPASSASNSVTPQVGQTITFGTAPIVMVDGTGTVSATGGGSGNSIVFTSLTTDYCTVSSATPSSATSAIVNGVKAGTCTIAANQSGDTTYSAAPQATLDITINPKLTLTISTLPALAVTTSPVLNISGTVTGGNGIQSLTINGTAVTFLSDGSFSFPVQLALGANVITIIATDNAGLLTIATRTITFTPTAPTLTITSPADGIATTETSITVTGTSSAATVEATVNGGTVQAASRTGNNFTVTVNLAAGMNTIVVTATDAGGTTSSAKLTIYCNTSSPDLAVTSPANDLITAGKTFILTGTASSSTLSPVTVSISFDGTTYSPTVSSGAFQQQLTMSTEKLFNIVVTATDVSSNTTTVQRNVIYSLTTSGDINGDGTVDVVDALMAMKVTVNLLTPDADQLKRGDVAPLVNGVSEPNGKIGLDDAILILRKAVGLGW